jgi:peptide/nickel transport system substrate-binding protein
MNRERRTARGSSTTSLALLLAAAVSVSCSQAAPMAADERPIRIAFGTGLSVKASGVGMLTALLYSEPLVNHDASGRPAPGLAASWHWEQDGHVLRLRLKQGVTFHDGTPLTAPLVVRALNEDRESEQPSLGSEFITNIDADNDFDIRIRLSQPDAFLLTSLNDVRITHPDKPDVGTGPFELVRRAPIVETKRYAKYHGGLPGSPAVQLITYETQRAAWAALMRGEADAAQDISREAVEFMEQTSQVRTYSVPQPFYFSLVFNHDRAALADPRVRHALSLAINRKRIVQQAMRGRGVVAESPIWLAHWANDDATADEPYNPRRAIALLEEAGYPLVRRSAGSPANRLLFRCLVWSEDPQYERIAIMVQQQLFDIGVHLELQPATMREIGQLAVSGQFDMLLAQANASRTLNWMYSFWRSPRAGLAPQLNTGYTGADAELDRLRGSISDEQFRASLREVRQQFERDAPAAFIAWTEFTRAVHAGIDVGVEAGADPFGSLWKWRRISPGTEKP